MVISKGYVSFLLFIGSTQRKQEAQMCQKGCCLFKSSLKPVGQLETNLVGMFIRRSS